MYIICLIWIKGKIYEILCCSVALCDSETWSLIMKNFECDYGDNSEDKLNDKACDEMFWTTNKNWRKQKSHETKLNAK